MNRNGRFAAALAPASLLAWFAFAAWWTSTMMPTEIGFGVFWPGWATIALMLASERWRPIVVAIIAVSVFVIMDRTTIDGVALGWAVAVALETVMASVVLSETVRHGRVPSLETNRDLVTFLAAGLISAVSGAMIAASVGFAAGLDNWQWASFAYVINHASGQWLLVPLLSRLPTHERLAGPTETLVMAFIFLALCAAALSPLNMPMTVFLVVPLLTWAAARLRARESLMSVLVLAVFVGLSTHAGLGPFADLVPYTNAPQGLENVVANIFLVSCLLVVLTISLAVGQQREESHRAYVELERLASIVRSSHGVAIIGTDKAGDITLFNPGAERMLGYTAPEVIGRSSSMLFATEATRSLIREFGARSVREFIDIISEPGMHGLDMRFLRKDGSERTFSMTLSRVVDDRGRLTGYVSTSEDVTDRVEAASLLRDALQSERRAGERLREIDAVKDSFVSSVSHELRTPLTSISGYLELLGDGTYGDLSEPQRNALGRVSDNSRRLMALIDDLLTLSRVEETGRGLKIEDFDLCDAVRSAFEVVGPQWATRDLTARLLIGPTALPLRGSRDMIERVVVNLLGNAVKFTPDGGWVTVELSVEGAQAVLRVSDSGIGISPADLERLFERFFRSSQVQANAIPGSGLGLSITRAMVEKHAGTINVSSEAGVGTTFEVRLPRP